MDKQQAKELLDKIVRQVFSVENPLSLEQFVEKFAFDVRLPYKVKDATDGSTTWATSNNPTKFIAQEKARNNGASEEGLYATQPIKDLPDLLKKWESINFTTSEFQLDSLNVAESDLIMNSENVFHSGNITRSKNILYSDGIFDSEYVFGSQNSGFSTFCIRVDDSVKCTDSFNVTRSANLTNCLFMHDCGDMQDSMFCSNMRGHRFCIANMEFEEAEYRRLHKLVVEWILSPQS